MNSQTAPDGSSLTPRQIVAELDKHIVGQDAAKRAVSIALRNRWRRMQVTEALRTEITPKNILMIGPTGCGKTEIARRLARLARAPFVKVEATKFTEVGYVGRDVDSIVKELIDASMKMTREAELGLELEIAHLSVPAQDTAGREVRGESVAAGAPSGGAGPAGERTTVEEGTRGVRGGGRD